MFLQAGERNTISIMKKEEEPWGSHASVVSNIVSWQYMKGCLRELPDVAWLCGSGTDDGAYILCIDEEAGRRIFLHVVSLGD